MAHGTDTTEFRIRVKDPKESGESAASGEARTMLLLTDNEHLLKSNSMSSWV